MLTNILGDPVNEKFHQLKLDNPKVKKHIGNHFECLNLLETAGFEQAGSLVEPCLEIKLATIMSNYQSIQNIANSLLELLQSNSIAPLTNRFDQ